MDNLESTPETIMHSITEQITTTATEAYDRFIFETVQPFCSQRTQREIKKEDLEKALIHYFPKHRNVHDRGNGVRFYSCPTCGGSVRSSQKYCDECGQNLQLRN